MVSQSKEGLNLSYRINEDYRMKGRKQKISRDNFQQKVGAEHRGYAGVPTSIWITEKNEVTPPQGTELLDRILSPYNINKAYLKVARNKGSHGIDHMNVTELRSYLLQHGSNLLSSIRRGTYRPNPVRRVEIPKDKTKTRPLGIPTVVDRVIQQAIHQVLSPIYEKTFSDNSFGFRPKRSAHQALHRCKHYISDGYRYAIDLDLAKFFDLVQHSRLIEILSRTINDGRVISLIHKYLTAGVVISHKFELTEEGVPQGGPLSPLLSNIMLTELDRELERRGHRFVRYADDLVILCKSRRGALRVKESITRYIEEDLQLKVNQEKSQIVLYNRIKFLSYSFYQFRGKVRFRIHPKSVTKLKDKVRTLTCRSNGWGNEKRKKRLSSSIKGWVNYFKYADIKSLLRRIDEWYRRRLRMVIWKQWKRVRTRIRNLRRLGVDNGKAYEWANTRKSYWRISKSWILSTTITNEMLVKAGYVFFEDYYLKVRVG